MFGDPYYGGNKNFAGWDLIKYPGPRPATGPEDQRMSTPAKPYRRSALLMARMPGTITSGYFVLGGYFSIDFLTMSSRWSAILEGSPFSSTATARQTSSRLLVSRKSMIRVPSVY